VKAKAHADDENNNLADFLANEGRLHGQLMDIGRLTVPPGWVDDFPVLCHQPLDYLTKLVVRRRVPAPSSTLRFTRFSDRWTVTMYNLFGVVLDPGRYIANVWKINVPQKFRETLWKEMNDTLVLGHRYHGRSDLGRWCKCGVTLSLDHILVGCTQYRLDGLQAVLLEHLQRVSPKLPARSLSPDKWGRSPWYPLLALRRIEQDAFRPSKAIRRPNEALLLSHPVREWLTGTYFWHLWRWRMKEIHDSSLSFLPDRFVDTLATALACAPLVPKRPDKAPGASAPSGGPPPVPPPALGAADTQGAPPPCAPEAPDQRDAILQTLLSQPSAPHFSGRRAAILRTLTDGTYE